MYKLLYVIIIYNIHNIIMYILCINKNFMKVKTRTYVQKLSEDCPENSTQVRNPGKALHN